MKTMRLVLLLTIVAFATTTFAGEQPIRKPVDIKISLADALNNKTFASEMLMHLNADFLNVEKRGLYYTTMEFGRTTYVIYGKYQEWKAFFNMRKWRRTKPPIGIEPLSGN